MKISCNAFYHILKKLLPVSEPAENEKKLEFEGISFISEGIFRENRLNICTSMEDLTSENNVPTMYLGPEVVDFWHVCCEVSQVFATISIIQEAYQQIQIWWERCLEVAEEKSDVEQLLVLGSDYLKMRFTIFDRVYTVLHEYPARNIGWQEGMVDRVYENNPEFDQTFHTRGLCSYLTGLSNEAGTVLYYYNFFQDSYYMGRVVIEVSNQDIASGIMEFLERFAVLVERCYLKEASHKGLGAGGELLEKIWIHLVRNESIENLKGTTEKLPVLWQWQQNVPVYQVIALTSNGYFHSQQTIEYYCNQLKCIFPSVPVVCNGDRVYMLRNTLLLSDEALRNPLAEFLRENLFHAGYSNFYEKLGDSFLYRTQADQALELGQRKDPTKWRYEFKDYVFDYMKQQCTQMYSVAELLPEQLKILLAYDESHQGSELIKTLYCYYYSQFNGQLAADKLFVHRTTFIYRMNKIRSLVNLNPEDPEETTHMYLGLNLLIEENSLGI